MNNMNQKNIRTIAVTGGKGGVGKTHTAINLSAALSMSGQRVVLLDADLGLSNIDIMLGLHPQYDLSHVLKGEKSLNDILMHGPCGLKILPGASGIQNIAQMDAVAYGALVHAFSSLSHQVDTLVIDTAAGIADTNCRFAQSAQEVIIVLTPDPTSLTDAYAMIKVLFNQYNVKRFRIITNMVQSPGEGRDLFAKLTNVTDKFLKVPMHYLGYIPEDAFIKKAVLQQKLLMEAYPGSKSAQAFRGIVKSLEKLPKARGASGYLEFFLEQFACSHAVGVGP